MPIKYKPSVKDRKGIIHNYYIHTIPTSQLISDMKGSALTPKGLQKIRHELTRRGVTSNA